MARRKGDQKGNQKGPQQHAQGQQGPKAHDRFEEQLHESPPPRKQESGEWHLGGHPLYQDDRDQHDEAEANSKKNRMNREVERGRLDADAPQARRWLHGSPPGQK